MVLSEYTLLSFSLQHTVKRTRSGGSSTGDRSGRGRRAWQADLPIHSLRIVHCLTAKQMLMPNSTGSTQQRCDTVIDVFARNVENTVASKRTWSAVVVVPSNNNGLNLFPLLHGAQSPFLRLSALLTILTYGKMSTVLLSTGSHSPKPH